MVILCDSSWYQQVLEQGRRDEREERQEDKEAVEKERQAVMRQLLRVLTHRFGEVPEKVKVRLQPLNAVKLETLTDVAFAVSDIKQFQRHAWLNGS
ncbi:MAG: DUF4351 domain-containing protein [Ardenticatenaceae bacterium]